MRPRIALALYALLLASCGGGSNPGGDGGAEDLAGADEIDAVREARDAADRGTDPTTLAAAKGVTELFVAEDPTIDPAATPEVNADNVFNNLKSSTVPCAGAMIAHAANTTTVSVDFGAGCSLPVGTLGGKASATLSKMAATTTVAFTFTQLTVNGYTFSGTLSASTTTGTSYTLAADLSQGTNHVTFNGTATLDMTLKGVTLDGTGTSGTNNAITLSGVHHLFGGCYADKGTITLVTTTRSIGGKSIMVTKKLVFDATTPKTGKVTVTINGVMSMLSLPAYGACPTG
jgi:hypothetical protein